MSPRSRTILAAALVGAVATTLTLVAPETALAGRDRGGHGNQLPKVPVMSGYGGAVSSVDRDASQAGIDVLRRGGNAADAAIAVAAMLGVVEPYTSGIGGGGFFVWHDGRTGRVSTIDGREAAPASFTDKAFLDPATGTPLPFNTAVNSGLSVGVPGTPALWQRALDRYGTMRLGKLLQPAERKAVQGIVVDQTFHDLTAENEARFAMFPETSRVFLRDGKAPAVGSRWQPRHRRAYREIRLHRVASIYRGTLGRAIVDEARDPSTAPGVSVPKGQITAARPRRLPGPGPRTHPRALPRARRLRHGGAELGWHRGRRDPQPARGLRPADRTRPVGGLQRGVPAPFLRGVRDSVRRPEPVDR